MQQVMLRRGNLTDPEHPLHLFPTFGVFHIPWIFSDLILKGGDILKGGGSEAEVTWEDQQNINRFSKLNNRFHELEDEIKAEKVRTRQLFHVFPGGWTLGFPP